MPCIMFRVSIVLGLVPNTAPLSNQPLPPPSPIEPLSVQLEPYTILAYTSYRWRMPCPGLLLLRVRTSILPPFSDQPLPQPLPPSPIQPLGVQLETYSDTQHYPAQAIDDVCPVRGTSILPSRGSVAQCWVLETITPPARVRILAGSVRVWTLPNPLPPNLCYTKLKLNKHRKLSAKKIQNIQKQIQLLHCGHLVSLRAAQKLLSMVLMLW